MNIIKSLRIRAGLTQCQLAAAVGIKQPSVASWESGKTVPKVQHLQRIAAALGCKVEELFDKSTN